jgi:hypothetical protein
MFAHPSRRGGAEKAPEPASPPSSSGSVPPPAARGPREAPLTLEDLDDDSLRIVLSKVVGKKPGEVRYATLLSLRAM